MRKFLTTAAVATTLVFSSATAHAGDATALIGGTIIGLIIGQAASNAHAHSGGNHDYGYHNNHRRYRGHGHHDHGYYYSQQPVILHSTPYCWTESQPRYDHHGRWVGDDVYRVCR